MIIYEVNIRAERAIAREYESWIPDHIRHLLQFPGFVSAELFQEQALEDEAPNELRLTIHYRLKNREALDRYLREDAPRMRKAAFALFGDRFSTTRRAFEIAGQFS